VNEIRQEHEEGSHEMRLDLPAAHSAGRMARQMLRQFAVKEALPEVEVETLEFVAGELLDNAVDHGGGEATMEASDLQGDIRMSLNLKIESNSWIVRVDDQGGGNAKEMQEVINPTDELPDLEDERGRGFFLITQMVDDLRVVDSADGKGLGFVATRNYGADS
jgi:anti-sigma regulatory factor (Ser/Thr protein kinase)